MSLSRTVDRLFGLLTWAKLKGRSRADAGKVARVQVQAHTPDDIPHVQPYGYLARARPGADVVVAAIGSHADQVVALLVGDRRYTVTLQEGEVCVADDLGQRVHLTRTGIVVDAPSIQLGAAATLGVARLGDPVALAPDFGTWAAAVSTALAGLMSLPEFSQPTPSGTGVITGASTTTRSE